MLISRCLWIVFLASASYGQINVYYTGRMMGYFRFPDRQTLDRQKCPDDLNEMNKPARTLY